MNLKANWKYIIFPIVVVALIVGIFIYIFAVKGPKTPATAQLVQEVFESNELMYGDVTVDYREKWNVDDMLQKAVACEKDDLRFDFFVFDSEASAEQIRKQYRSYIRENRYSTPNIEVSEGVSNYMLYSIKAAGMYTVCMRVENTLVFAYCDEENATNLNKIMIGIGYFEE